MNLLLEAERAATKGKMQLLDTDGDTIAVITSETPLFCAEHWIGVKYYGVNLYAVVNEAMELLETYDDTDEISGKELANNVIQSIRDGFTVGATVYVVPAN